MVAGVDQLAVIAKRATRNILGRDCVLTSRSGDGLSGSIRCYFDAKHEAAVDNGDGVAVSSVAPFAIIDDEQAQDAIGRAPSERDRLTVSDGLDAGTYEIEDPQPDGSGSYRCWLRLVS